ncbi:PREDICTED: RNA-binding protein 33-like isoform X2 [Camelina sativa]|uniref:RNA-binding protein 33-like isoform X2 n=1 Tax=Camelina sativa TaxID=90675 RepID=A0ABM0YF94_CAMSA|nr:PREDICTED: RNA-binding protein 33-like isoform X2 [Camelina sativa]
MDSCNSGSLQSSSDDHESSSTGAPPAHSSFFLPPFQPPPSSSAFYGSSSSSSATYLNFVNNLISDDILNQTHLLPPPQPPPPPPPPPPSSSRNPRKRTRASRRAPTTVLTTDTSNFRAMVQEFTGVPASPFSHPFSSTTRRFDIFRSPSDPLTYNPFRPMPQKPHHQPLNPSSSSLLNNHHSTTSMTFPDLPLPQNQTHQVSTFQSLLSHQHHHHNHQTTLSPLHELDSMNLGSLQQNHHPTADDHNHQLMMRQFSEFDRRTEKRPEIHNNVSSSSSSAPTKGSSDYLVPA